MAGAACQREAVALADYRFTRRDVREHTGWGHTQLKVHLKRLEEMEYLLVHHGGRGQRFVYELVYAGEGHDGRRFLPRLLDVDALEEASGKYGPNRSGSDGHRTGPSRPQVGAKSAPGRTGGNSRGASNGLTPLGSDADDAETALLGRENGHNGALHTAAATFSPLVAEPAAGTER